MYCLFIPLFFIILPIFVTQTFTDKGYTIVHERAELAFYERSLITEDVIFTTKKIDITTISITLRFTMATDVGLDKKIMMRIAFDKLSGSEYKRTGTSVVGNLCKAWEKNILGCRERISANGYLDPCGLKKGVSYYLNDFSPDTSTFPKFLPYGNYRIILNCFHENTTTTTPLFLLHWYARVEKPLKF